jgi:hypothetical protein
MKIESLVVCLVIYLNVNSCSYEEKNTINYSGYYDFKKEKLKIQGVLINGNEEGDWKYYDEFGNLVQNGNYKNGYQVDNWYYKFPDIADSIINWKHVSVPNKIEFSLPNSYFESNGNSSVLKYAALDTINASSFTISVLENRNKLFIDSIFDMNLNEFREDCILESAESNIIKGNDLLYYFDEFLLTHKERKTKMSMYMIYCVCEKQIVVFTHIVKQKNSAKGKFLLGEIFYHSKWNSKRIANPFTNIDEIVKR